MGATVVTPEGSNGRCVALHVDSSSEEDRELSELRWEAGGFIEEGLLRRNVGFVEFEAVSPSDGLPHVLRWDGAPKPRDADEAMSTLAGRVLYIAEARPRSYHYL